ncbi:unnamed protein product [Cochlearia groenlandica]
MAQAHYPPCKHSFCMDAECCGAGRKYEWPEVVGKSGEIAVMTIERENEYVKAIILHYGDGKNLDFCCNRVFVYLGPDFNVLVTPKIG